MSNKDKMQTVQESAEAKPAAEKKANGAIIGTNFAYVTYDEGGRIVSRDNAGTAGATRPSQFDGRDAGAGANRSAQYAAVTDADMRLNIQDEAKFDNRSVPMLGVEFDTQPMKPGEDISPAYDASLDYTLQGVGPGRAPTMKQGFARRKVKKTITKNLFVKGRNNAAFGNRLFPNSTFVHYMDYDEHGYITRERFDQATALTAQRGDYLVRGIDFEIGADGQVVDVTFDVTQINAPSANAEARDVMPDHARVDLNQAEQEIPSMLEKILAKGQDFYTPIADGIPQPARHIAMYRAISDLDGAVVYSILKGLFETHAITKTYKDLLGANQGSLRAAGWVGRTRDAATAQRLSGHPLFDQMSSYEDHPWRQGMADNSYVTAETLDTLAAANLLSRGPSELRKATDYTSGLLKTNALKEELSAVAAYLDAADLITDDRAFDFLKEVRWAQNADGTFGGLTSLGLIFPFNPNTYFTYRTDGAWAGLLEGACNIKSVTSPIAGRVSTITSVIFNAMLEYLRQDFAARLVQYYRNVDDAGAHRLTGNQTMHFTVPFYAECERFSLAQYFTAMSLKYVPMVSQYVNLHYNQYRVLHGQDLRQYQTAHKITYADITANSSFTDVGSAAVLKPTAPFVEMWMDMPRHLRLEAFNVDEGPVTEGGDLTATFAIETEWLSRNLNGGAGVYDRLLWPVFQTGYIQSAAWSKLRAMDIKAVFKTVDMPVVARAFHTSMTEVDACPNWDERCGRDAAGAIVPMDNDMASRVNRTYALFPTQMWTTDDNTSFINWTVADELAIDTYGGRIAPNPYRYGTTFGLRAAPTEQSPFGDDVAGSLIILEASFTGRVGRNDIVNLAVAPIEDMEYAYLRQVPLNEMTVIGEMNYCNLVSVYTTPVVAAAQAANAYRGASIQAIHDMFGTDVDDHGNITYDPIRQLADRGILITGRYTNDENPTQLYVNGDGVGTYLTNEFVSLMAPKVDFIGGVWSPFDGAVYFTDEADQIDAILDDRYDQKMDVMFGFKMFQQLFCGNMFEKIRLDKFGSNNLACNNDLEKDAFL